MSFSPPIINDYINQLEALKRDSKENSKESEDLIKLLTTKKQLNNVGDTSFSDNSWLLNCMGDYYKNINDYQQAIKWYMKSADLGNTRAMCNVANYFYHVDIDYKKVIEWYNKSSDLGNSEAMRHLGVYYNIKEKNCLVAFNWWTKSANLNNNKAMFHLGYYYEIKKGDYLKAIDWYMKSIISGNNDALNNLKDIIIDKYDYDYIYNLMNKYEGTDNKQNEEIKYILLDKLSKKYIYNKMLEENNYLKSIKNQGIDKALINQVLKHF